MAILALAAACGPRLAKIGGVDQPRPAVTTALRAATLSLLPAALLPGHIMQSTRRLAWMRFLPPGGVIPSL